MRLMAMAMVQAEMASVRPVDVDSHDVAAAGEV